MDSAQGTHTSVKRKQECVVMKGLAKGPRSQWCAHGETSGVQARLPAPGSATSRAGRLGQLGCEAGPSQGFEPANCSVLSLFFFPCFFFYISDFIFYFPNLIANTFWTFKLKLDAQSKTQHETQYSYYFIYLLSNLGKCF